MSFLYKVVLSFSAGMMRRPKGVALLLYGTVISWCPGKDPDGDALSPLLINRSPYIITRFVFIYIYTHVLYTIYSFLSSISFLYCHRFVSSCFFSCSNTRGSLFHLINRVWPHFQIVFEFNMRRAADWRGFRNFFLFRFLLLLTSDQ